MSTTSTHPSTRKLPMWQRGVLWVLVCLALLAVFALYLDPVFMLTLADQVWACF